MSKPENETEPQDPAVETVDAEEEVEPGAPANDDLTDALADEFAADDEAPEEAAAEPSELDRLRVENQALKEQLLRERADFDNIRKRLRREADESGNRAVARFVRPLLLQLDHFGHALEAASPDAFQDFAMGVTMIRDGLVSVLGEAGISPVEHTGAFDPAVHEVVAEIPSPEPKGHIVAVQRTGYRMGDQLVRAAQVVVSAGQPAAEEPAAEEPAEQGDDDANSDQPAP